MPDGALSASHIDTIIRAGMQVPSANNEKSWEFLVIRDPHTLAKLAKLSPYAGMIQSAIVVCGNLTDERRKDFWVQDCSAAMENMLLEATVLGIGSVWIGVYPLQERVSWLSELFELPMMIVPFAVTPLGYPAEQPERVDRYESSLVHHEKW